MQETFETTDNFEDGLAGLSPESIQTGLINQQFFFHLHLNALTELLIEKGMFTAEQLIERIDKKGQEMEDLTKTLAQKDGESDGAPV